MLRRVVARTVCIAQGGASTFPQRFPSEVSAGHDISTKLWPGTCWQGVRGLHVGFVTCKTEGRKEMLASMPRREEGTEGEVSVDIYSNIRGSDGSFPDENTPDMLFDGVRFADLPILHAKISKNNTLLTLTNAQGVVELSRSCGIEGFKNTRKGTNIAAQATAISLATRALNKGLRNVRVKVNGLGPGRMEPKGGDFPKRNPRVETSPKGTQGWRLPQKEPKGGDFPKRNPRVETSPKGTQGWRLPQKEPKGGDFPKRNPRVETPKRIPRVETPKRNPRVETFPKGTQGWRLSQKEPKGGDSQKEPKGGDFPKRNPRVETPKRNPRVETPKRNPRVETPKRNTRVDTSPKGTQGWTLPQKEPKGRHFPKRSPRSAVKGLTMGGLNVVSITDSTPIMFTDSPRPRKAKKL
ncbi:28S ribosomal protein S11, mitochondrial [Chionoecetes opilio]|uniref:28S ribosomal protein S11, mitochondrial n=1 Tax=Chionoecetes opilio TaxID=41210 RepID=A0A8J5D414_CHIOP|nr:28S ribosomal protein S11, mitochondrial [Chionoecetes opilio]